MRFIIILYLNLFLSFFLYPKTDVILQLRCDNGFQFVGHYEEEGLNVIIKEALLMDGKILCATKEVCEGRDNFCVGATGILIADETVRILMIILAIIFFMMMLFLLWFISLKNVVKYKTKEINNKNIELGLKIEALNNSEIIIKKSLEEKEILLKEIHHRVKNNLQIISSLIKLQLLDIKEDNKDHNKLLDTASRIETIASIHEQLYQSENLKEINMKRHIENIFFSLKDVLSINNSDINLKINCENIFLTIEYALPLGLIISEFLTNSFKHGFKNNNMGQIFISAERNDNLFKFVLENNGVSFPNDINFDTAKTLGLTLIKSLSSQIHGNLEMINSDKGLKYILEFLVKNSMVKQNEK
ncbi:MAG: hypothetical protein A2086_16595 [Spirochaetes bacterium GWD1_27_9]|nr:MAG: hypothetical protein A2Z98_06555 [Spirochaetes bacterium GWB1_27_13]OHD28324.1 MAG: hypothetical protein A2Y34_09935 [Spirochaetes bacterium GWC1_27_15]OHD29212.1 MAG: hypothetical protein A2086_16595 [Spirochaetes bacterium GWD1_27_9]